MGKQLESILLEDNVEEIFTLKNILDLFTEYELKHFYLDTNDIFGARLLGYCDKEKKELGLYLPQMTSEIRETVIHEILHGLKDKYGIVDSETKTTREAKYLYEKIFRNKYNNDK